MKPQTNENTLNLYKSIRKKENEWIIPFLLQFLLTVGFIFLHLDFVLLQYRSANTAWNFSKYKRLFHEVAFFLCLGCKIIYKVYYCRQNLSAVSRLILTHELVKVLLENLFKMYYECKFVCAHVPQSFLSNTSSVASFSSSLSFFCDLGMLPLSLQLPPVLPPTPSEALQVWHFHMLITFICLFLSSFIWLY